jgi:NAD(P)-dependent dehydrogenase (short-subunit alcohol dehydrogenase family)
MKGTKKNYYSNPVISLLMGVRAKFVKQQVAGVLKDTDRLDGKTVLVDGASSGLGLAVATEAARRGAHVIMACRSGIPEKGEQVKRRSGNPDVEMMKVDFLDFDSIRDLASGIRYPVDLYICNAAMVPSRSRKTKDGLEEMFMVNYLSKFYFIRLLLERGILRKDPPVTDSPPGTRHPASRIIVVSSESHRNPGEFDWDGFGKFRDYGMQKTVELYGYYKLLLTTFVVELSRRLNSGSGVTIPVLSLCPGPVNSNIARESPAIFKPVMRLVFYLFFRSPRKAAIPVIYLSTTKDVEDKKLDYLFRMTRKEIDEKALDPGNGRRLWELSEALLASLGQ